MDWAAVVAWTTMAGSLGAMAANVWLLTSNWRLHRRLLAADLALRKLCVNALLMRGAPVWEAWAATMGTINVEVSTNRKPWADG